MIVKFKKVRAKNFMSIGNSWFEFELDQYPKTLIKGKNGSGKTVLADIITFALFNRAYRKINKTSLPNDINGKEMICEIYFDIGTDQYRVVRGMKPNVFEIWKNDEKIQQDGDYQKYLETNILKFGFEVYCQLVMIGSASYVPFLQLKAPERRAFVESILDIEIFSQMNKIMKEELVKNLDNRIYENKSNVDSASKTVTALTSIIDSLKKSSDEEINLINQELKGLLQEYKELESDYNKLVVESEAIEIDYDKQKQYQELVRNCIAKRTEQQSKINNSKKQVKFLTTTSVCSECGQDITQEHKEQHMSTHTEIIDKATLLLPRIDAKEEELNKRLKDITASINLKSSIESKMNVTQAKMESLKRTMKMKVEQKNNLSNKDTSVLGENEVQLKTEIDNLNNLTIDKENLLKEKSLYDKILVSLKDSGAKAEIVKTYIPIICTLVNSYLEKMNLFVKFTMDENFNEKLKNRQRDDYQYESFSMGQRMRINIAMLAAWRDITKIRTGITTNLLLLDEVTEILDDEGFEVLLNLTNYEKNLNCLVISHKQNLEQLFDDVVEIGLVKGFTKILD